MRTSILLVDDHKITCDGLSALIEKQPEMEVVGEAEKEGTPSGSHRILCRMWSLWISACRI